MHTVVSRARREPLAAKVPEVTALFWVVKLLTTAGGEAVSDYLALHGYVLAGVVEVAIFLLAVWLQLRTRRYVAAAYWFLALAIAIFGTGVSDALHLIIGIPYAGTTLLWAVILAVIFWLWYRSEGTLSIHSITTRRRELFYWAVVFATFALGTALGDFTANALGLGYLASGVLFAVVIMIPAVARRGLGINPVLAFWSAYVITRPLGASFADYFSKPRYLSGLNYGDGPVSAVALVAIVILVGYLAITRNDIQQPAADGPGRARRPVPQPASGPGYPAAGWPQQPPQYRPQPQYPAQYQPQPQYPEQYRPESQYPVQYQGEPQYPAEPEYRQEQQPWEEQDSRYYRPGHYPPEQPPRY
ncbi:MAG: hypothetical protein ACLQDY_02340 [Streptosporangiaceae bacterium]